MVTDTINRPRSRFAALFVVGLIVLSFALQFSTAGLASVDGYFHARYAQIVWNGGLRHYPPAFPWLPLTIRSADRYFDHHMLFHVLLAPFVVGDAARGAKWASVFFGSVAFVAVYVVLQRRGIRRPEWWLLAMFALAPDFLSRMEMPRVQAVSLVWLLLVLETLIARRYLWLLPLAVGYTWLYDAFPFLLAMSGLFAVAILVIERRLEWRAVLYPTVGIVFGLVINPYFPNDVWFIVQHYLGKAEIDEAIRVGTEWYPYPLAQWLGWPGALAIAGIVAALVWREWRRLNVTKLALLLIGTFFFALAWRSRRFVEYGAPFVLFALASTQHEWVDRYLVQLTRRRRIACATVLLVGLLVSIGFAAHQMRKPPPPERYRGGATWLAQHTPADAIVFTADWTDFPLLFFYDQRNRYVIGLDPTYLARRDADLFRLWHQLGRGELRPPSAYLSRFDSDVVFSDRGHADFIRALDDDPGMTRAYEDDDCVIFTRRQ
ncbi:MAG TPA: hypothetical protein VL403_17835 [Candidatus Kryptonia bacterium]|nr:hypothetical protein [Candidatus Kryptonia bacterium]